ncbi:alpha/beta fold hydrolase [Oricola thermophila]|uniref:Alpha/beta fold hydrolase n=1 Tax=Oricola thermophila TaxID=2742145 RepID=A0A6N1VCY2_9HYPH|nr:alpha/beta hydrolase [Oricola thermophila]QKV18568.1 alpha/beta fold hydrolase [Oricola thermophila]
MYFTGYQDARIAYRKDGTGPALVLVHGTGGDGEANWAALAELLRTDYTIIRPDYSGSGSTTDEGGPLTAEFLAGQVLAAADAAGAERFHLMGFSLGAAVAARIAADHADRVRSLILLAGFAAPDAYLRLEFELWRELIARDREAMARLVLLTGFSPDTVAAWGTEGVAHAVRETHDNAKWDGMARQVELDLTVDVSDALPRISARSLVIGCLHDRMVPVSHPRAMAARIPGAEYRELPTGHLAPMERPDLLAGLVRDFLADK